MCGHRLTVDFTSVRARRQRLPTPHKPSPGWAVRLRPAGSYARRMARRGARGSGGSTGAMDADLVNRGLATRSGAPFASGMVQQARGRATQASHAVVEGGEVAGGSRFRVTPAVARGSFWYRG